MEEKKKNCTSAFITPHFISGISTFWKELIYLVQMNLLELHEAACQKKHNLGRKQMIRPACNMSQDGQLNTRHYSFPSFTVSVLVKHEGG